ncbi:arsenate-mycothiol transferase ArsC [Sinomicrobium sp. M5D2P17]
MNTKTTVFKPIEDIVATLTVDSIPPDRKETLQPLIDFIRHKIHTEEEIRINFICTHNSRRSHLSQVWAQTLAHYFNIRNVYCYSGGTEATALYPMVTEVLEDTGFKVDKLSQDSNPVYAIKYSDNEHPVIGFSKKLDDGFNPASGFAAVMTCSQADGGCPFIAGAEKRVPVTFEDPKIYDGTPQQKEKYHERSLQIATELFYVFSEINK